MKYKIYIIGFMFMTILTVSFVNFLRINHCVLKIVDNTQNAIEDTQKTIDSIAQNKIDTIKIHNTNSINTIRISYDLVQKETIESQKKILDKYISEIKNLNKGIIDGNAITFLVSFVLVFLGGILIGIDKKANEKIDALETKAKDLFDESQNKIKEQIKDSKDQFDEQERRTKEQIDKAEKRVNDQIIDSKDRFNAQERRTKEQIDKAENRLNEQIKESKEQFCTLEKSIKDEFEKFENMTKEQFDSFEKRIKSQIEVSEKYLKMVENERNTMKLYVQIQSLQIITTDTQSLLASNNYLINNPSNILINRIFKITEDLIKEFHNGKYKSISEEWKKVFEDIFESIKHAFEIDRILDEPKNKKKTRPIEMTMDKLEELQNKILEL